MQNQQKKVQRFSLPNSFKIGVVNPIQSRIAIEKKIELKARIAKQFAEDAEKFSKQEAEGAEVTQARNSLIDQKVKQNDSTQFSRMMNQGSIIGCRRHLEAVRKDMQRTQTNEELANAKNKAKTTQTFQK